MAADKQEIIQVMEDFELRHRRQMRHHYTVTSNVLLMGYRGLSDGARITYQVIDSFDWSNEEGLRKGYAFPSKQTLAEVRGVGDKTIQRHLAELEQVGLVKRESRPGRPNLIVIEDPNNEETSKYLARFEREGVDKNVHPNKKNKREEDKSVNEDKPLRTGGSGPESIKAILSRHASEIRRSEHDQRGENYEKREYLAREILAVTKDEHSLGFYRNVAATYSEGHIFQTLGRVRELASEGGVRKNRGALFVTLVTKASSHSPKPESSKPVTDVSKTLRTTNRRENICSESNGGAADGNTR